MHDFEVFVRVVGVVVCLVALIAFTCEWTGDLIRYAARLLYRWRQTRPIQIESVLKALKTEEWYYSAQDTFGEWCVLRGTMYYITVHPKYGEVMITYNRVGAGPRLQITEISSPVVKDLLREVRKRTFNWMPDKLRVA